MVISRQLSYSCKNGRNRWEKLRWVDDGWPNRIWRMSRSIHSLLLSCTKICEDPISKQLVICCGTTLRSFVYNIIACQVDDWQVLELGWEQQVDSAECCPRWTGSKTGSWGKFCEPGWEWRDDPNHWSWSPGGLIVYLRWTNYTQILQDVDNALLDSELHDPTASTHQTVEEAEQANAALASAWKRKLLSQTKCYAMYRSPFFLNAPTPGAKVGISDAAAQWLSFLYLAKFYCSSWT